MVEKIVFVSGEPISVKQTLPTEFDITHLSPENNKRLIDFMVTTGAGVPAGVILEIGPEIYKNLSPDEFFQWLELTLKVLGAMR